MSFDYIGEALERRLRDKSIIILTGGLGPTPDDFTKYVVAQVLNRRIIVNEHLLVLTREFFKKRGREMTEANISQAEIIEGCSFIVNEEGTAPAIVIEDEVSLILLLPGVPREIRYLWENGVKRAIVEHLPSTSNFISYSIHAVRIPESELSAVFSPLTDDEHSVAFLPRLQKCRGLP